MEYKAYNTICHNRHIFIDNGAGRLLIDTGSPVSLHKDGRLDIAGQSFPVPAICGGIDADYLSKKVVCETAGLVGMDILSRFQVWINTDLFGGFISFNEIALDFPSWTHIRTYHRNGVPGIDLKVNLQPVRMLLDTGAPRSYIEEWFLFGCGGSSAEVVFNDKRFEVDFIKVPRELDMTLSGKGFDGIIGYDLIESFRIILNAGEVWFPPQGI